MVAPAGAGVRPAAHTLWRDHVRGRHLHAVQEPGRRRRDLRPQQRDVLQRYDRHDDRVQPQHQRHRQHDRARPGRLRHGLDRWQVHHGRRPAGDERRGRRHRHRRAQDGVQAQRQRPGQRPAVHPRPAAGRRQLHLDQRGRPQPAGQPRPDHRCAGPVPDPRADRQLPGRDEPDPRLQLHPQPRRQPGARHRRLHRGRRRAPGAGLPARPRHHDRHPRRLDLHRLLRPLPRTRCRSTSRTRPTPPTTPPSTPPAPATSSPATRCTRASATRPRPIPTPPGR